MSSTHEQQEQQEPVQQQLVDERSLSSGRQKDSAVLEEQSVGELSGPKELEFPSMLQPERTAQTSPTPATPSAVRVRPGSVIIDVSEAMPKPPAYDHGRASPASRQESGHQSSIHFQHDSANRAISPTAGATPPQAQAAYRRHFLEEDELPEYMMLSDAGPPFRIPANQSTTYTVTPSQGPVEFQQQPHQQPSVSNSRQPRIRSLPPTSSVHTTPSAVGQHEGFQRQPGAWTLEYWVDDTITYLCYLMDPKLSGTTALVPRNLADNTGSLQNRGSSLTEVAQPAAQTLQSPRSDVSGVVSTPPLQEQQQQQQQQGQHPSQQSSNTSRDQPRSSHLEAGVHDVVRVDQTIRNSVDQGNSLSSESSEQSGLERVPTGHIRGRPPPLNRTRNAMPLAYMSAEQTAGDMESMIAGMGRHRGTGAAVNRVPRADPAVGSSTSQPASEPTATIEVDTQDTTPALSGSDIVMPSISVETGPVEVQPVESADTVTSPSQERHSTERAFGVLPPVHHVRINDGYPGEEADTMLAHAMDLQPTEGDGVLPPAHSNAFNNALTSEFFKSPTFAFVSAEDPQTWIWWSSHHESNLQRCRQEGPHEEVMMWWRTRIDFNSQESKARRRRERLKKLQQGIAPDVPLGIRGRWKRFLSLQSSTPHQESMEITMRVRGLYYSWREETPELGFVPLAAHEQQEQSTQSGSLRTDGEIPLSEFTPQTWVNSDKMRLFTLVRDDSLIMGQRVKGGPVAEIWIHEGGALQVQDSIRDPLATIPTYQSVMAPPIGESSEGASVGVYGAGASSTGAGSGAPEGNEPASFIRSGSSSVISNNGTTANTFMTDVSAFTGGPVRSTIASTFNHPAASDRPSSAPSLVGRESLSSSSTRPPASVRGSSSDDSRFTSSFPAKLRQRQCVIRVKQGLNTEVETFALSTGPRLPELFDLYTDQSLPGPSRKAFVCALTTFGTLVVIAFTAIAFVSR
ncbi:hypothetical protein BGZ68_002247 [Mortierella alpina]|nr:hypothetical protein BGZ68_002247 [Mortierella alpina]